MGKSNLNLHRNIIWPILLLLLVGILLIILDRERITAVLTKANWQYIPGALLFTAGSYSLVSYSYAVLAHLVGIRMGWRELASTYYVTAVMNRVVRSGGIAGFSVRYWIMKLYDVTLTDVLSSSFIHVLLASLVMLGMLPIGILYIFLTVPISTGIATLLVVLAGISIFFCLGAIAVLTSDRLRRWVVGIAARLAERLHRPEIRPALEELNQYIQSGVRLLRLSPLRCGEVLLLVFIEWWANVIALGYCLSAFGPTLEIGAVAALFVVGIMAGVITALPGGMGVQEGVMTVIAVALGASFEQAILAAMLFRVVHSIIPYLISPIFYVRLLHPSTPGVMV